MLIPLWMEMLMLPLIMAPNDPEGQGTYTKKDQHFSYWWWKSDDEKTSKSFDAELWKSAWMTLEDVDLVEEWWILREEENNIKQQREFPCCFS